MPKAEFDGDAGRILARGRRPVATEVPDTLLLAEAFWLLEGYFVRTLGMHRVYNRAFMHMLRDEDNAKYRMAIKKTLEFDPQILKRYVNFMSNPDETTAIEQFGKGDKYFGVAALFSTLPGLPMYGHGQVEGYREKYGMEFRKPKWDELPTKGWSGARPEDLPDPAPPRPFADVDQFFLYDLFSAEGGVDENVFAYSNGSGPARSLVVYHNRFGSTAGSIRGCRGLRPQGGGRLQAPRATEPRRGPWVADRSLGVRGVPRCTNRAGAPALGRGDPRAGRACGWMRTSATCSGSSASFATVRRTSGRGSTRCSADGASPWLEEAQLDLQLEPVHSALRAAIAEPSLTTVERVVDALAEATGTARRPHPRGRAARREASRDDARRSRGDRGSTGGGSAAAVDAAVGARLAPERSRPGRNQPRLGVDELRLAPVVAAGLRERGLNEAEAWSITDLVRVLLDLPRPGTLRGTAKTLDRRLLEAWLARDDLRAAIGVNTWEGTDWLDRDRFEAMLRWAARLDAVEAGKAPPTRFPPYVKRLNEGAATAGYRVERLTELLAPTPVAEKKAAARKPSPKPTARPRTPRSSP